MKIKIVRSIENHLKYLIINIYTIIANRFIHRDESIWLFGSWMGNRFADNSRFLFQYLDKYKKDFGISKVIWVSRNQTIIDMLRGLGYEAYLCNSKKGHYYHLKSGVHVICNMYAKTGNFLGDIDGQYSYGAKKIQLWHGVGVKACARLSNSWTKNTKGLRRLIRQFARCNCFSPGAWNDCFWLTTSKENQRVTMAEHDINESKTIIANYPRNCNFKILLIHEKEIIEEFGKYKKCGFHIVLYLPTFRSDQSKSNFVVPTSIPGFNRYLEKNKILWLEKSHSITTVSEKNVQINNIEYLDKDLDVNILLPVIDILVSDYSSATTDALARGIPTIDYIPDYHDYMNDDRGFVADYFTYHPGYHAYSPDELMEALSKSIYFSLSHEMKQSSLRTTELLLGENCEELGEVAGAIIRKIKYK